MVWAPLKGGTLHCKLANRKTKIASSYCQLLLKWINKGMSIFKDWSVKAKLHQSYWSHMSCHYWYWGFNWDFKIFFLILPQYLWPAASPTKKNNFTIFSENFRRSLFVYSTVRCTPFHCLLLDWQQRRRRHCSTRRRSPLVCVHTVRHVTYVHIVHTLVFVCVHTAPNDDVLQTAVLLHSTCPCPRLGPQHVHT